MVIVGIDQGTTGTTVVAYDHMLQPLARAYREVPTRYPAPGRVEQDPEGVVTTVVEAVGEILEIIGGPGQVVAAGLDNQGESVVAWDAVTGEPLSPILVWSDERGREIVEALSAAGHAERVRSLTGLQLDPYFSAAKLRWLLDNVPAVRAAADRGTLRFGTLDAWLGWRLGGQRHLTDHSTASRTQLMGLESGAWEPELLDLFGIPAEALPEIRPSLGDWGTLSHLAWGGAIPWRASLVDQPAALAGHGCIHEGEVKATYGTGCFVLSHAGTEPRVPPPGVLMSVAWSGPAGHAFALDGGVFTAGTAMRWLQSVGLLGDVATSADLAASATDDGVVWFLPAITGLGAPWWAREATGVFSGITAGTTRAHLVKAVLDGIAFRVRDVLEAIWATGVERPAELRVDGGMTANPYLMQRQADILGIPLTCYASVEATARGAAALAAIAAGLLSESDLRSLTSHGPRYEPRLSADARDSAYHAWQRWAQQAIDLSRADDPSAA